MTPLNLKIIITELIGNLIGRYYPANIPAISIGQPSSKFTVKGLEVYIPTLPQLSRAKVHTRTEKWEIFLYQHQSDTPLNIHTAANLIRDGLQPTPDILFMDKPGNIVSPDDLPIIPQAIIRWEIYESTRINYK